ncbi:hypothetical protein B0H63DRAFT_529282 [Podospora didyma]|uniref:CHAT domain-containing protein n=1 Tax=Podospora didyma TaxID=330526 RepID=A0AAE0K038_9PEZI|nr:hypothetical protein B0H63DRAFT_529282 [Podospora didyma]
MEALKLCTNMDGVKSSPRPLAFRKAMVKKKIANIFGGTIAEQFGTQLFNNPIQLFQILDRSILAAKKIGDAIKVAKLSLQYGDWLSQTSQWDSTGQSLNVTNDENFYILAIHEDAETPIEWGNNATDLVLQWAKEEVIHNTLSESQWNDLFATDDSAGPGDFNNFVDFLGNVSLNHVATLLLGGIDGHPSARESRARMHKMQSWLLAPERLISRRKARLLWNDEGETGTTTDGIQLETSMRVSNTLALSFASPPSGSPLVSDEELLQMITACDGLVAFHLNNRHRGRAYNALLQRARLIVQRHVLYQVASLDESMAVLDEAEDLFSQARRNTFILDPLESYGLKTNITSEFLNGDHDNLALFVAFEALKNGQIQSADIQNAVSLQGRLDTLRETMQNSPSLMQVMDVRDGKTVSLADLDNMLSSVDDDLVLVDFIHFSYADIMQTPPRPRKPGTLKAALYRRHKRPHLVDIPAITVPELQAWVDTYLDHRGRPLRTPQFESKPGANPLDELIDLVEPLFNPEDENRIKPNETIILCSTGVLHRIPIHAIPIDGHPLIVRQAVGYCPSLTILHRSWIIVNPLPNNQPSSSRVAELANTLRATTHHQVALVLDETAYTSINRADSATVGEILKVRDIFTALRLKTPALAIIIGCESGISSISSTDDVLRLLASLLFAGAGAVISTLWPIDDLDGADFGDAFHDALREQVRSSNAATSAIGGGDGSGVMDLASAMHSAVKKL